MEATKVSNIEIERCYTKNKDVKEILLAGVCDASKIGYAACIYLWAEYRDEFRSVKMIAANTKIASLSNQSIPRRELLRALILSRLLETVKRAIQQFTTINSEVYLTDSQLVLTWIKTTDKKYEQFVKNRVAEIRQKLKVKDWECIQGKENISNLASRGCNLNTSECTRKWFNRPEWLLHNKERWSTKDLSQNEDKDEKADIEEVLRGKGTAAYVCEIESTIKSKDFRIESVIDSKQFSNFYKLLRITAYILRFKGNCRNKWRHESPDITTKEVNKARLLWVKQIQTLLVTDSNKKTKTKLGTFVYEEEIYRCGGRLPKASLLFESKHPAIMPKDHHITELIIKDSHNNVYHNGVKETLTQGRS